MKKENHHIAVCCDNFLFWQWFNIPLDLMDLDPNEVMEIVVFNGNSGNATHITDKEQIQHIVENLNGVEVKRSKPSLEYTGYSFKVTIYLSDGNEAGDWNNFIINSDDTIRKDPFFYSVTKEILITAILKVS